MIDTLRGSHRRQRSFWRSGELHVWATGSAVALSLLLFIGLVAVVGAVGLGHFWPASLARLVDEEGRAVIGQIVRREPAAASKAAERLQVKVANRDLYGQDFRWIEAGRIVAITYPPELAVVKRREWGDAYGVPLRLEEGSRTVAAGDEVWDALTARLREVGRLWEQLKARQRLLAGGEAAQAGYEARAAELDALRAQLAHSVLILATADGRELAVPLAQIVRAYRPNAMGVWAKAWAYAVNVWEFLTGPPRESNTEGGIFPAIFGTVLLVLIMSLAVMPVGVLAAVYLKEYAGEGLAASALRIAIRNLAGVPSIVYGIFGLGFFIYTVGGSIDRLYFSERLPAPTFGTGGLLWASLTLALLTLPVVIVAAEEGLASVPAAVREASYALGATRFETVWRVVVPQAMPGILTGMILGIARATGEVAPLMLTGVVKLAQELPVDGSWPFLHLERKFMHLGFFIYDLGFQSPNVEAARPMLFATALVLIAVVVALNIAAILLRNRMRGGNENPSAE